MSANDTRHEGGLLSLAEAASYLGICTRTLREHVKHGEIAFISVGRGDKHKRRKFHRSDLEAFIAQRREREWPATKPTDVRTTFPTSQFVGLGFTALRDARRAEKLSRPKPSDAKSRCKTS